MKQTVAKNTDDLRAIIDDLDKAIANVFSCKSEKELNHADHQLGLAFKGLQYGVMTVAGETRDKVDARRVQLRYER